VFNRKKTHILKKINRENDISFFNIPLTCFKLILSKYSNEDEVLVGTPVRARSTVKLNDTIGYFENTVVIRSLVSSDISLKELFEAVVSNTNDVIINKNVSFEKNIQFTRFRKRGF
jgi:surfactin family lipopeptide synthetase A